MKRCALFLGTLIVFANAAIAQPIEAEKILECFVWQTTAYLSIQRPLILVAMINVSSSDPMSEEQRKVYEQKSREIDIKSAPYKSNMDRFKILYELPENQIPEERQSELAKQEAAEINAAKQHFGEAGVPVSWFTARADKCAQALLTE